MRILLLKKKQKEKIRQIIPSICAIYWKRFYRSGWPRGFGAVRAPPSQWFQTSLQLSSLPLQNTLDTALKGTLSKDDDDGSENDGKKMNFRSFKLNRVCLDPLNMSNAGDFSWS